MPPVQVHAGQIWSLIRSKDELTDKVSVALQVSDANAGWSFGFVCAPGDELALGVLLQRFPEQRDGDHVLPSRIDSAPIRLDRWQVWGKRAELIDRSLVPAYFASREKLVIRFNKLGGDTYDLIGRMSGTEDVRQKFADACAAIGAPLDNL